MRRAGAAPWGQATSRTFFFVVHRMPDALTVAIARVGGRPAAAANVAVASAPSIELVDLRGQPEVGLRETALGVRGERQADLVPAVQEDVRMMVCLLRNLRHAVDESDRGGEILELALARDRLRQAGVELAPALVSRAPLAGLGESLLDLGLCQRAHLAPRLPR